VGFFGIFGLPFLPKLGRDKNPKNLNLKQIFLIIYNFVKDKNLPSHI
jgi:hypothetical protein